MSDGCPTCSHSLALLISDASPTRFFHCERCGTIVVDRGAELPRDIYRPKLVDRVRKFAARHILVGPSAWLNVDWHRLGIAESINTPEDRK